ncbi:9179_t:CDS:2 [Entrophospora sp. SA101]|nr:9179_t:CDS:2 [Entrophospora sp. SA101]
MNTTILTSKDYVADSTDFPVWTGFHPGKIAEAVNSVQKLEIDNVFNSYSELCLQYDTLRTYYGANQNHYSEKSHFLPPKYSLNFDEYTKIDKKFIDKYGFLF